jgi:hypothetical protein
MLNAGYLYLEVKCLGRNTHQTVPLNIVRRSKTTPVCGLLHAMQGLLSGSWLSVQTQSFGRASAHNNFGEQLAVSVVAGRAIVRTCT